MPTPRWSTVLLDLDGTLVDTIGLIVASYHHAFDQVLGERRPDEEVRSWIGRPLLPVLEEVAPGHAHDLDRAYREWNLANTHRLVRRYEGVEALLDALDGAGVRSGVVTSKRRATAAMALEAVGLGERVALLACLEDTEHHKPHPAPLLHATTLLDVEPSASVYVGDAAVDVRAARAAGTAGIGVTWGAGTREDLAAEDPTAVVDSPAALRDVLLRR